MPHARLDGNSKSKTTRSLQLLWNKREYAMSTEILLQDARDMFQMDQQKEPEEKYELETVLAISSVKPSADTKDISRDTVLHAEISECTCEEPYVGKLQVRFCEGFYKSKTLK